MNFESINAHLEQARSGVRDQTVLGEAFLERLFGSSKREWFLACRAWLSGAGGSDPMRALAEIGLWLDPFRKTMAELHLECSRLLVPVATATPGLKSEQVAALAARYNLPRGLVRDFNQIGRAHV